MKNKLLSSAFLIITCALSLSVNAQLEVNTSGDVIASKAVQIADSLIVGKTVNIAGGLNVAQSTNIANNLSISSYSTTSNRDFHVRKNLTVTKDANIYQSLKVSKNVAIGDTIDTNVGLNIAKTSRTITPIYGIKSHIKSYSSMPTSSIYGIYGFAEAISPTSNYGIPNVVGVFGQGIKTYRLSNTFCAGVAGLTYMYGGAGVYGGIRTPSQPGLPTNWDGGCYAGYFDGCVQVNGTLIATVVSTTSDERSKENIRTIDPNLAENLNLLQPVSYTLKQDSAWAYDKDAKELHSGIHYGLIAQDVQKIFPELVYERGEQLSINYTELIPLLIMKVQELSAKVEEQEKKINEIYSKK